MAGDAHDEEYYEMERNKSGTGTWKVWEFIDQQGGLSPVPHDIWVSHSRGRRLLRDQSALRVVRHVLVTPGS